MRYFKNRRHQILVTIDDEGKRQGAVNFNGERTKKPDSSGKHNIKI
jgi:hypothetical protein